MTAIPPDYSLAGNKTYCTFCPGYCCYRLKGAILHITAEDINRMARYFQISDGEVRTRFLTGKRKNTFKTRADDSCIFLANDCACKRCSIHEARPKQCRDFPYNKPCPYLESDSILALIQPRIEALYDFRKSLPVTG